MWTLQRSTIIGLEKILKYEINIFKTAVLEKNKMKTNSQYGERFLKHDTMIRVFELIQDINY